MANRYTSTVASNNKYATPTHKGDNMTLRTGPIALDARLLDDDIIPIVQTAYAQNTLEEVAEEPEILGDFFADPNRGRRVILSHLAGIPFMYGDDDDDMEDDSDSDDEEEKEEEKEDDEEEWDGDDDEEDDDEDREDDDMEDDNEGDDKGEDEEEHDDEEDGDDEDGAGVTISFLAGSAAIEAN